MTCYSFNFRSLYYLGIEELFEIVQIIRGEDGAKHVLPDKDVYIRGVIIPFMRRVGGAPKDADKDEVMRQGLIRAAKKMKVKYDDWEAADTYEVAKATRKAFEAALQKKIETLSKEEREKVYAQARQNLADGAAALGVSLAAGGAILAGEMSGFGIYLATTTGLKALSVALGTTFGWGVYQGATTVLSVILGPVGWAVAGLGVVAAGIFNIHQLLGSKGAKDDSKLLLTTIALILAIGESPFELFGLSCDAAQRDVKKAYRSMMKTFHPDMLEPNLPPWLLDEFNAHLLRTQEAYEKVQVIWEGRRND